MIYHITYDRKGKGRHKVARPVRNREELMALRGSEQNLEHLVKARQGDDREKGLLVQLAYNLGHVSGKLAGCKSIGSFFFHDVDCYDKEQSEAIKELILSKKEQIGLVMLERSASGGWHLVCRRERGTTILENQVRVACILKLEMDTNTHDLQRVSFSTSASPDDLVYLDDALFEEPLSAEACEDEFQRLKIREMRGQEQVPAGAKRANKHYRPWEEGEAAQGASPNPSEGGGLSQSEASHNPSSPRIRFIAQGVMKEKGLLPSDFTDEGGRHTSVKMFLSGATQLLSKAETNSILAELMPNHWRDQNIQQLVNDFYANYTNPSQRLFKYQEQLFIQSRRVGQDADTTSAKDGNARPPVMPQKLPKLIQLLTSKTPDIYKAAVAHAVFPPLATHLCGVRFAYTDHVEHEGTLMNCLMAGTGAGKGCIDEPIRHIMADIKRRDQENERREAEWKKDCQKKGAPFFWQSFFHSASRRSFSWSRRLMSAMMWRIGSSMQPLPAPVPAIRQFISVPSCSTWSV